MEMEKVLERVRGIPHMTVAQAREMTSIILENRFQNILELGFRHGVSTCYMAAALQKLGDGRITTIDLKKAQTENPNVDTLLKDLGLTQYVTVYYEPTSYIWRLMKMLEQSPEPRFDFCYIDGAHDWGTDGFAFFLVDRLLRPGGLIIFDDLDWTYDSSPSWKGRERVLQMPEDERSTPQVRKIYELLVKPHPSYGDFALKGEWAYARKLSTPVAGPTSVRKEIVYRTEHVGLGNVLLKAARKLLR